MESGGSSVITHLTYQSDGQTAKALDLTIPAIGAGAGGSGDRVNAIDGSAIVVTIPSRGRFDVGAEAYERLVGRWSRLYLPALIRGAALEPGHSVLDVAAGTGEATALAAEAVAPRGSAVGVDISLPMLRVGVQNVSGRRATFAAMDALTLAFRSDTFDAVVCQLGLMFFGDRVAALREMRRVLRPGGRVAIGVWGELDDVSFFAIVMTALIRQAPAEEERLRQGFSLGRQEHVADLLTEAEFRDIVVTREKRIFSVHSDNDILEPLAAGTGQAAQVYCSLSPGARSAMAEEVRRNLARFQAAEGFLMPGDALVATATK